MRQISLVEEGDDNGTEQKNLWLFLGTSYGLFGEIAVIVLALIGFGVFNISLEGEGLFLNIIMILFSWTPSMAVFIHLKKLFGQPINWKIVFFVKEGVLQAAY